MEYIIDTCTWVSLIRYYKPFDKGSIIYDFFKRKIEDKEIILLKEVSEETVSNNDNKLFKKIPAICSILQIKYLKLPEFIKKFDKEISITINNTCT